MIRNHFIMRGVQLQVEMRGREGTRMGELSWIHYTTNLENYKNICSYL